MATEDDLKRVVEQEQSLVFERFDEEAAFRLGCLLRDRAVAENLPIVIDIRTWERPLFYCALPGSAASNAEWARRKRNAVQMFAKSTYRMVLEQGLEDQLFPPRYGLNPADYALAGGGFPITVRGAGVIGAVVVSGLPQRQDHNLVAAALCDHIGRDPGPLMLADA